ncbi:MAG: 6-bladed beta-propeller [Anaerolineae bacterium]|nr:6-bladed beta-propeller [Anaerolineae bacterium]
MLARKLWIVAGIAMLVILAASWNHANAQEPALLFTWGSEGSAPGQFNFPRAIAIGPEGSVYVADSENHRVQVFTPDGEFITQWGTYGSEPGEFDVPQGIAVDAQGHVYVGDRNNNRIQKFTADGQFLTAWGSQGSQEGQFTEPRNLAVDAAGQVYVSDSQNHRIQVFDDSGNFIAAWGSPGSNPGQFNYATGVAAGPDGLIYACDAENHRIQVFDSTGHVSQTWGSQGSAPGQFDRPYSLTVDAAGYVYVIDEWNHRVQVFTAQGDFVTTWGSQGSDRGQFEFPHGAAVDQRGYVYIVDEWNHRIQVFAFDHAPTAATSSDPVSDTVDSAVPPPTLAPASSEALYFEDFQDNAADGWTLDAEWMVMQDPTGNYGLYSFGPGQAALAGSWQAPRLSFRLNIINGGVGVIFRPDNNPPIWVVAINPTGVTLYERTSPDTVTPLAENRAPLPVNTWFDVVITHTGTQLQVYINGQLTLDHAGSAIAHTGQIGFVGPETGEIWLDDVTLSSLER